MRDKECLRVADDALAALSPELESKGRLARKNAALAADIRRYVDRIRKLFTLANTALDQEPEPGPEDEPIQPVHFTARFRCTDGQGVALSSRGQLYYRANDKGGKWKKVGDGCTDQDALAYVMRLNVDFQRIVECKPREVEDAATDEPDVSLPIPARRFLDAQGG